MIKKKDIGLIVDTNILKDVIESSESSVAFDRQLADWIIKIISEIDSHPHGKTVTLFVSKQILCEYYTHVPGLKHKQVRKLFQKKIGMKMQVSPDYEIYLSRKQITLKPTTIDSKHRLPDKSDEKFRMLLENVLSNQKWKDWAIIFASRDKTTFDKIRDNTYNIRRVNVVDSKHKLEQAIEC